MSFDPYAFGLDKAEKKPFNAMRLLSESVQQR